MTNPDRSQPGGLHQTPPPGHPRVRVHVPVADDLPSLRLLEQSVSAPGQEFLELPSVMLPVAARFRDHSRGSLGCPACAGADAGGPITGWPPVELPTLIPGGQPVPSSARHCPAGPLPVPLPRFSHPASRSDSRIPTPVPGTALGPHREPEVVRPRRGCCPADRLLHLLNPPALRQAMVVGFAKARCGRLIFAANLTLRSGSVGLCVGCAAAGSTP